MNFEPSEYQRAIWRFVEHNHRSVAIEASQLSSSYLARAKKAAEARNLNPYQCVLINTVRRLAGQDT